MTNNHLHQLADTPEPPYYAVVFTSVRNEGDDQQYAQTAARMIQLAAQQPGYLGVESVRDETGVGVTVSYWADRESIRKWRLHAKHQVAQQLGRTRWYADYRLRICRVEAESGGRQSVISNAAGNRSFVQAASKSVRNRPYYGFKWQKLS